MYLVSITSLALYLSDHLPSGVNAGSRLGGTKRRKGRAPPASPGRAIFCDLEMAYFGDSEVLNLKVFFIRKL